MWEDLQDGRGVRCEDQLPPHKYIKNTSTHWTTPTEHLLNAGRRTQTSKKARKSLQTWVEQKKKEKKNRTKEQGLDLHLWEELWRKKSFRTLRSCLTGGDGGGSFGATEESTATGVQRAKQGDSHTEYWCWPELTSLRCLSAKPLGQVGAGSWGLGFRGQTTGRRLRLAMWRQPEGH